jgi:hypothetical protein
MKSSRFDKPRLSTDAQHTIVYRNDKEFCGWPFYCGLWKTSNGDIVTSFKKIPSSYSSYGEVNHQRLTVQLGHLVTIRSRDNGKSWDPTTQQQVFDLKTTAADIAAMGDENYEKEGPVDFLNPDTLVMTGSIPLLIGPESRAWMRISTDGGMSWRRPILLPLKGLPVVCGHGSSSYATRADGVHILGLTAMVGGWTRPLVYASTDGENWYFLSFMTPESGAGSAVNDGSQTPPFGVRRHLYTRVIRLADDRLVASARFQRDPRDVLWSDMFGSRDGGRTWSFLSRITDWGAPADLVPMSDGRIVAVYGYRMKPYGIRYRVSEDGGETWSSEVILRDDGGSWDLGYPRVIEHQPGKLLAVYYMNCKDDPIQQNGGVRHIAQTVFQP